ncbi:hypothetical protein BC833DRAFT_566106, partial [Globomyces pollinis-pini]
EVKKVFEIAEHSTVTIYAKLDDGTLGQIIDVSGIEANARYYVQTDDDALKKIHITTMEKFFERLRTDRKRPESDINKVQEVFCNQGILLEDLMGTGELAITDAKLKDYGITQLGLRTAILAVIKSNIQ